ncbi:MAG: 30S ribosome-binding factor RbfA [Ignavibacteria bacterium]|nr:30S ribosome-binding factor RbfA [Ignavibacteria bacterium]
MSHRLDKVASLLKEELSLIFLHRIQNSDVGLITVTNVKVSPDLQHTKIYLSVYDKSKRDEVLEKVNNLKKLIRSELASKVQLRYIPELHFFIDDTLDYVEKIEGLFKQIHSSDGKEKNDNQGNS